MIHVESFFSNWYSIPVSVATYVNSVNIITNRSGRISHLEILLLLIFFQVVFHLHKMFAFPKKLIMCFASPSIFIVALIHEWETVT